MQQADVEKHFDQIAANYDYYKKNHGYYHSAVKRGLKSLIRPGESILDWGCGTGDILAFLKPSYGVGFDISTEMVKLARNKFKRANNLRFVDSQNQISGVFDYIVMVDVIEHLVNPQETFSDLYRFASNKTRLIISFVGPLWVPVIWILGKLKPKTPEGPHKRIDKNEVIKYCRTAGFRLLEDQSFRIFPCLPISPLSVLVVEKK